MESLPTARDSGLGNPWKHEIPELRDPHRAARLEKLWRIEKQRPTSAAVPAHEWRRWNLTGIFVFFQGRPPDPSMDRCIDRWIHRSKFQRGGTGGGAPQEITGGPGGGSTPDRGMSGGRQPPKKIKRSVGPSVGRSWLLGPLLGEFIPTTVDNTGEWGWGPRD